MHKQRTTLYAKLPFNFLRDLGHIKSGELRALAVAMLKHAAALPDVSTLNEAVPGYETSAWFGVAVPKGTPAAVIAKLNREINAALADPTMKARLEDLGGEPIPSSPAEFWKPHADETEKWAKVVMFSGAKAE